MLKCDKHPRRTVMHTVSKPDTIKRYLCCECHIKDGGSPADWHPKCMKLKAQYA